VLDIPRQFSPVLVLVRFTEKILQDETSSTNGRANRRKLEIKDSSGRNSEGPVD